MEENSISQKLSKNWQSANRNCTHKNNTCSIKKWLNINADIQDGIYKFYDEKIHHIKTGALFNGIKTTGVIHNPCTGLQPMYACMPNKTLTSLAAPGCGESTYRALNS